MVIAIDFKLENNAAAFLYGASTKSFVIQNGPKTLMIDFFLILPLCQGHDNFYELPLTFSEMILNVVFSTNYC